MRQRAVLRSLLSGRRDSGRGAARLVFAARLAATRLIAATRLRRIDGFRRIRSTGINRILRILLALDPNLAAIERVGGTEAQTLVGHRKGAQTMVIRIVKAIGRQRRKVHAVLGHIHIKAALGIAQVVHARKHALQLLEVLLAQQLIERILNIARQLGAIGILVLLLQALIAIEHVLILVGKGLEVRDLAINLLDISGVVLKVLGHRRGLIAKIARGILQRIA